jgi:hypothetical protein
VHYSRNIHYSSGNISFLDHEIFPACGEAGRLRLSQGPPISGIALWGWRIFGRRAAIRMPAAFWKERENSMAASQPWLT